MPSRAADGKADSHMVVVIVGGYLGVEMQIVDLRIFAPGYCRERSLAHGISPSHFNTLSAPLLIASSLSPPYLSQSSLTSAPPFTNRIVRV
jgi:hypothetical protein